MIQLNCSHNMYTYNTYHLVKAFFPEEEVCQNVAEDMEDAFRMTFPDGREFAVKREEIPAGADRSVCKYAVDTRLYEACRAYTGRELAWGLLTGVRPTKLAMQKLEEGMDRDAFVRWFREDSYVSGEKAQLAWEIAGREKSLLDRLDCRDGYSLYVGIPFCPSVCSYCSFSSGSLAQWQDHIGDYLAALLKELAWIGERAALCGKKMNTVYIGGGTPTTLTAGQLEELLSCIDRCFSREHLLEYTVEAGRPDSITEEKLQVLRGHGITRISINPQTMQQRTLDLIGRRHTVDEIKESFHMARGLGFDNINMDLIAGLPGEKTGDMKDTLEKIRALDPDSLTVHSLAVKRAARMGQEGYIPGGEEIGDMLDLAAETARAMGMFPYYLYRQKNIAGNFENTGYAKVDKAGIYNILIMEEKQSIIAAGAGASTKIVLKEPVPSPEGRGKKTNLIRQENVKAIDAYVRRVDEMIERKGEWL